MVPGYTGPTGCLPFPEPPPHSLTSAPAPPKSMLYAHQPLSPGGFWEELTSEEWRPRRRERDDRDRGLPTVSIQMFYSVKQIWQNIKSG